MNDDEYQRIATEMYERVKGMATIPMLFSERLLVEEIARRGDTAQAARMHTAYGLLVLAARMGFKAYEPEALGWSVPAEPERP